MSTLNSALRVVALARGVLAARASQRRSVAASFVVGVDGSGEWAWLVSRGQRWARGHSLVRGLVLAGAVRVPAGGRSWVARGVRCGLCGGAPDGDFRRWAAGRVADLV